jgi:hypothetical protein
MREGASYSNLRLDLDPGMKRTIGKVIIISAAFPGVSSLA